MWKRFVDSPATTYALPIAGDEQDASTSVQLSFNAGAANVADGHAVPCGVYVLRDGDSNHGRMVIGD